jgi:hypothetical protein
MDRDRTNEEVRLGNQVRYFGVSLTQTFLRVAIDGQDRMNTVSQKRIQRRTTGDNILRIFLEPRDGEVKRWAWPRENTLRRVEQAHKAADRSIFPNVPTAHVFLDVRAP